MSRWGRFLLDIFMLSTQRKKFIPRVDFISYLKNKLKIFKQTRGELIIAEILNKFFGNRFILH